MIRKKVFYFGTAAFLGIPWYYAIYIPWPGLMSHKWEGEPPDYYLGLYDKELLILMVLTAVVCSVIFMNKLQSARSKDWLMWSVVLPGSGILIFSLLIVLYAFSLQIIGIDRPKDLDLYHPTLFVPGPLHTKLIMFLTVPLGGLWFSFLSYYTVLPMAFVTQWAMRKVAV